MIRKINNRQKRDELIDGYFNKNWCCDLDEVKNAVFDTIQELEEANDINATRVIELTQKIGKAIDMLDLIIPELWNISNAMTYKIKEVKKILGEKENEK